jgi:hypothetical protein
MRWIAAAIIDVEHWATTQDARATAGASTPTRLWIAPATICCPSRTNLQLCSTNPDGIAALGVHKLLLGPRRAADGIAAGDQVGMACGE